VKLGKEHVVLALVLVALATAFSLWLRARPATSAGGASPRAPLFDSVPATGPSVTGQASPEGVDPATLPPVPDVGLDRAPEWPRDPFFDARLRVIEAVQPTPSEAEPELVLASILHSAQRRLAIVNGRIVRAGDRIGTATIRDIEPRAVVVDTADGARRRLELRIPAWGGDR
jgi:hypothetical protein